MELVDVHDVVVAFIRQYGVESYFRTPAWVTAKLTVLEVQEKAPNATVGQIMYCLETIRESKSLKNPGRRVA